MSKLIVCLGYSLQPDNSIHNVLRNRLNDAVKLCKDNKGSTLLLMGSSRYGDIRPCKIPEALAMKEYLLKNFATDFEGIEIETEKDTKSTIEQLCFLKEFIGKKNFSYNDLVIVSSEFFSERVKLYADYVFGNVGGILFIGSSISKEITKKFKIAEGQKLKEGKRWLKDLKKGDDQEILKRQKEFQVGVLKGEIDQPPLS